MKAAKYFKKQFELKPIQQKAEWLQSLLNRFSEFDVSVFSFSRLVATPTGDDTLDEIFNVFSCINMLYGLQYEFSCSPSLTGDGFVVFVDFGNLGNGYLPFTDNLATEEVA